MKTFKQHTLALALAIAAAPAWSEPARYATPEAALSAVVAALEAQDRGKVLAIFGPENEDLLSTGNQAQDREVWGDFLRKVKAFNQIELTDDGTAIVYAGRDRWPFPVPLVRQDDGWSFDAEAGREEILMRRIGLNELAVIDIMNRVGSVQATFRMKDHDGDGVMEFAASILSDPGKRNGLYWPDELGTEQSPLGPFIARANDAGYNLDGTDKDPEPYVGYFFRILQGQSPDAPGGAYSYMVGDNMVAGHALLAYPAAYGDTGIMTFMVGENGIVYERDLGPETMREAEAVTLFNPDQGWKRVE